MVSGDLKVKLALTAAAVVGVYLVARRVSATTTKAFNDGLDAAKRAAVAAVEAVNPLSANNLAYRGANAVVQAATGEKDTTLGTKLYEWTHPNEARADAPVVVWTVADQEDADVGYAMDVMRAENAGPALDYGYLSRRYRRKS